MKLEKIGRIPDPHDFSCPHCRSSSRVLELDDDRWQVILTHEPGCLWINRRKTDPQAN